jgi:hypothetical protein
MSDLQKIYRNGDWVLYRDYKALADRIEELEADLRKMALDYLAAQGQAAEAYRAQLAAKHKLARAVEALKRIELSTDTRKQGAIAMATLAELNGKTDE